MTILPVLDLRSVSTSISTRDGEVPLLVGLNFTIGRGEFVGLVGESGSGKSMTARTIISSLPPKSKIEGEILLSGENILQLSSKRLREIQARSLGVIFQDPRTAVDPLWTIEDHITEGMRVHERLDRETARARGLELLQRVGIRDGPRRLNQYPDQLSGGLLQRIVIAGALAGDPDLLIADEPTTALDVTTQAEIAAIFSALRKDRGLAMLFITHDLGLAASLCDRILVMYAGRIVEAQASEGIFVEPAHPYTRALVNARPSLDKRNEHLAVIPGNPANARDAPPGCPFSARCPYKLDKCTKTEPFLRPVNGASSACLRSDEIREKLHV